MALGAQTLSPSPGCHKWEKDPRPGMTEHRPRGSLGLGGQKGLFHLRAGDCAMLEDVAYLLLSETGESQIKGKKKNPPETF